MDYLEEAKKLVNLPQSCMKKEETSVMLLVHPRHANNVKKGIIEELDSMLQRYSETLNGIPMAYENIKLLSSYGVLLHDNVYAHVHISAIFYVFTPEIGSVLTGVVCKKSKFHIGLLVYKKFNVSATCPDDMKITNWCGSRVEEKDEVKITVTFLNMKGYVPTIKVQIDPDSIPEHTTPSLGMAASTDNKRTVFKDDDSGIDDSGISSNDTPVGVKKKKKSFNEEKSDIKIDGDESSSDDDNNTERKKKLKKMLFKKNVTENSDLDDSLDSKVVLTPDSLLESSTKKKKKKRKSMLENSAESPTKGADEAEGSFVSSPSRKKKKRDKEIKMEPGSPSVGLVNDSYKEIKKENSDSLKHDLNLESSLSPAKKKKKDRRSLDNTLKIENLDTDSSVTTPIRKIKNENLELPQLDLNSSTLLSPAKKKKKDKKNKESDILSPKTSKAVIKSTNDELDDLPFDFDDDLFKSPPTKDNDSRKQKSETTSSQLETIKNKKRKAEETPDNIKPKKKKKI